MKEEQEEEEEQQQQEEQEEGAIRNTIEFRKSRKEGVGGGVVGGRDKKRMNRVWGPCHFLLNEGGESSSQGNNNTWREKKKKSFFFCRNDDDRNKKYSTYTNRRERGKRERDCRV